MICNQMIANDSDTSEAVFAAFYNHVQTDRQHIVFMAVFQAFFLFPPSNLIDDNPEYEELVDLCDRLGNVELGVSDIDMVTSSIVTDKNDICPICLENMPQDGCIAIRKINTCGHRFCGCCIETWLSSHKTCPVCKTACIESGSYDGVGGCEDPVGDGLFHFRDEP